MTRSANALVTAAFALAACGSTGGSSDAGVCHSSQESCATDADCCKGFSCAGKLCTFTAGGSSGGQSGGSSGSASSGGSTGSATGSTGRSGSSTGSSSGGSGGCAAFGASCQGSPCCDPYSADAGTGSSACTERPARPAKPQETSARSPATAAPD